MVFRLLASDRRQPTSSGAYGGASRIPEPGAPAGDPVRHLERAPDAVARHESRAPRAAAASRQPATITRPSRESAGAHPAQSAYGSRGWHAIPGSVGGERALVAGCRALRLGELIRLRAVRRALNIVEYGAWVTVRERARERMDQNQ